MNLFITSEDPGACARALDDRRLRKSILETAQMLNTVLGLHFYMPTHKRHPCTLWVRDNARWTTAFGVALHTEYVVRFEKRHASNQIIEHCDTRFCLERVIRPLLFVVVGDDEGPRRISEPFSAYRDILNRKWRTDRVPPHWTKRGPPSWASFRDFPESVRGAPHATEKTS